MADNDERLEESLFEAVGVNLGVCCECKRGFLANDIVIEVVRGKKPRHEQCWKDKGSPRKNAWGHGGYVHKRRAAQVSTTGYLNIHNDFFIPGCPAYPWTGGYFYVPVGKVNLLNKEVQDRVETMRKAKADWDETKDLDLFPADREEARRLYLAKGEELNRLWAKSEEWRTAGETMNDYASRQYV